ncbi:MAG: hypothetical protein FWG11_03670 [Promicromonosporaceae bacterium]|nr:hypothetical protein [Promicromonosporaceae bacterium]
MSSQWSDFRSQAAHFQHERLQERRDAQHAKAEEMLAEFLPVVRAHGPRPVPLRVTGYGGKGVAKTPLRGWYLRTNRTAALGEDGHFYLLIAPLSPRDRLLGCQPDPSRPPLVLGEGGRDGESIDLADALERVLPGWRDLAG